MTTLFLIRHGLTAQTGKTLYGRTEGIDLDDRGRSQADALIGRFEGIRVHAIYTSPLERCVQTVEPLAAARRLPLERRHALVEMEAGSWTGRPLAQVRRTKAWRVLQETPSAFRFPEGESFPEAQARAIDELTRIVERHPRGSVVVATHGDIARMLVAHYAGAHLDRFQRTIVDTAGVSVVHLDGGRPYVLLVNDTGGLGRFAAPRRRGNLRG
ncbi:MAG: MSMEG_4193 family putative phosphomutase [Actinomycetota bacterium]